MADPHPERNEPILDNDLGCLIGSSWKSILDELKKKNKLCFENSLYPYLRKAFPVLIPVRSKWLAWSLNCSFNSCKVIMVKYSPYTSRIDGNYLANGVALATDIKDKSPIALDSISKSLHKAGIITEKKLSNDLLKWQEQGVLLLNLIPTLNKHNYKSDDTTGWTLLTKGLLLELYRDSKKKMCIIFLDEQSKNAVNPLIQLTDHNKNVLILSTKEPSPLGFDSNIFKRCNSFLGNERINWNES